MQINIVKHNGKLVPETQSDLEKIGKLRKDRTYTFTTRLVRNPDFHRKYFALIGLAFNQQDVYKNEDNFRKIMQMKAGYFDVEINEKGSVYLPKSIRFDKMEQNEFEELYSKVLDVICSTLKCSEDEILDILRFA